MAISEEIARMLGAVKEASGAVVVGLFDCDLERLHASSETSDAGFWKVFSGLECLAPQRWHADLRRQGSAHVSCTCDAGHTVQSVVFRDRWALVILARGPLAPASPSVVLSAIPPLADLLPLNRMKGPRAPGAGPTPAELAIPLWWLRRDQ